MRTTLPTVKPMIEALQLADLTVRRRFRTERSEIDCAGSPAGVSAEALINGRSLLLGSIQDR